ARRDRLCFIARRHRGGRAQCHSGGRSRALDAFAQRRGPDDLRPRRGTRSRLADRPAGEALYDGPGPRTLTRVETFEFFRRLAEDNPAPETELEFGNVYQLLVAVVLSAQATDVGVNKATRRLFADVHTPQQMIGLGEE